jgi:hypothetical protein
MESKIMETPNFTVYSKLINGNYLIYNYDTKEYNVQESLVNGMNSFYVPKPMLPKHKEKVKLGEVAYEEYLRTVLISYSQTLIESRNQLLSSTNLKLKFDWFDNTYKLPSGNTFYRTHTTNVVTFFKRLSRGLYEHLEPIYYDEYKAYTKCFNAGLFYLKEKGKYDCHGYDFKMFYATNMKKLNFFIPMEKGEYKFIETLPQSHYAINGKTHKKHPYMLPIQFGIYHVMITSDDPLIKTKFTFSKHHWYTSYSLCFAMKLQEKNKHNLTIELIIDDKPNAYVYDDTKLIRGFDIFTNWTNRLINLKKEFPKNGLIKALASAGWGHFQDVVHIFKTDEQLIELCKEYNVSDDIDDEPDYLMEDEIRKRDDTTLNKLIDISKPIYKMPLRLLPFITSYSRCRMGNIVDYYGLEEKVIRIHTDGIVLSESFTFGEVDLIPEEKTTGNIEWESVNDYSKFS